MSLFGPLGFVAPLALLALLALPALWWLLRVTPPSPRRIDFPPLRILLDLKPADETPARTPLWLMALRIALAALAILAMAGPLWNATQGPLAGRGPLLILIDGGFAAAGDWPARMALVEDRITAAGRDGRLVALASTAERPREIAAEEPARALDRLRALEPGAFAADRRPHLPAIERYLAREPAAEVIFVSDGVFVGEIDDAGAALARLWAGRTVTLAQTDTAAQTAIAGVENRASGLAVRLVRATVNGRDVGVLRASDRKGAPLGETPFNLPPAALESEALVTLPVELRNEVSRVEIVGERSAGGVALLDGRLKRRKVGVVSGATADTSQPLLSPAYYVTRALQPHADVRELRTGPAEAIARFLDETVDVLILTDVGGLDQAVRDRLALFIERGGVVIRFAGSRLAAADDDFTPVRLRRGGRTLGGSLAWDTPRTLQPFRAETPFRDLTPPDEVSVSRQLLAEPDADLPRRTWAALVDGTPIVTADARGRGTLALFHVTADTGWSNLPLSGLFVDMLRRLIDLARPDAAADGATTQPASTLTAAPFRLLDGFGRFRAPGPSARAIPIGFTGRSDADTAAGLYGQPEAPVAVNVLIAGDKLRPFTLGELPVTRVNVEAGRVLDLRAWILAGALLLLAIDAFASLWLAGRLRGLAGPGVKWASRGAAAALAVALLPTLLTGDSSAQERSQGLTQELAQAAQQSQSQSPQSAARPRPEAALSTRLAYVITGDRAVDDVSRAGLQGLTQALSARTAFEPGEPVGVDLATDELAYYPLLYWPISTAAPAPGDAAIRRLASFMTNGGTVLFDTRDALTARPGGPPTPEQRRLRQILATVDVPELEPVPRDHVLNRAFYIIDRLPGRYDGASTWLEALPPQGRDDQRPARAGDSVSSIVITGADLAGAWAVGRSGEPLFPLVPGTPRQRELALRGGINIVMYVMTGNYKADQVHVPALLERLGQ